MISSCVQPPTRDRSQPCCTARGQAAGAAANREQSVPAWRPDRATASVRQRWARWPPASDQPRVLPYHQGQDSTKSGTVQPAPSTPQASGRCQHGDASSQQLFLSETLDGLKLWVLVQKSGAGME